MTLRIQAVLDHLIGCQPVARFILEATARDSSLGWSESEGVRSMLLAKQLHIVEGTITAALGELVAAGLMRRIESAATGKGRPKVSYQIAPQIQALLSQQQNSEPFHSEHLQRIFSGADFPAEILGVQAKPQNNRPAVTKNGRPAPPGARSRLSSCNRLLLGALLANADEFGVVASLSSQELRGLTGLDAESLSHRLRRLRGMGLIRSYVPGVTSSIFCIKKVCSTFFLNLNHPGYDLGEVGQILVHRLPLSKAQNAPFDVLRRDVQGFRSSQTPLNLPETPEAVLKFLALQRRPVFDALQIMLYKHASELLSRHWSDLAGDSSESYEWLLERIKADLQPPAGYGAGKSEAPESAKPQFDWKKILGHFTKLAVEIAKTYRTRFGAANCAGLDHAQFCILPVLHGEGDEVIAIFMRPRPEGAPSCSILLESLRGDLTPEKWKAEQDVPLNYRFYCGLLTPPEKRLLRR